MAGTSAKPREEAIRRCVGEFREKAEQFASAHKPQKGREDNTGTAVFQALEEMKLMWREQSRMFFEGGSPIRSPRNRKPARQVAMITEEAIMRTPDPEVRLVLCKACADEIGLPILSAILDYIIRTRRYDPEILSMLLHLPQDYAFQSRERMSPDSIEAIHALHNLIDEAIGHLQGRRRRAESGLPLNGSALKGKAQDR